MENLIQGVQEAISHATPFHNITPRSRPGFTRECKEAQQNAKRLKRRWRKLQTAEAWEAFREARNQKSRVIKKAMRDQYRKETDEACENPAQMWKRCKWSRNREAKQAAMPPLHSHPPRTPETDPVKKAQILLNQFFPPPPNADLSDTQGFEYE